MTRCISIHGRRRLRDRHCTGLSSLFNSNTTRHHSPVLACIRKSQLKAQTRARKRNGDARHFRPHWPPISTLQKEAVKLSFPASQNQGKRDIRIETLAHAAMKPVPSWAMRSPVRFSQRPESRRWAGGWSKRGSFTASGKLARSCRDTTTVPGWILFCSVICNLFSTIHCVWAFANRPFVEDRRCS